MPISESTVAQLFLLVDEEVKKQVNQKITKYIDYVSKKYDISLNLLLRDLGNIDNLQIPESPSRSSMDGQCMGVRSGNTRCKLKGRFGGYCRWHQDQKKSISRPTSGHDLSNIVCKPVVEHTHTLPPLYMKGCPACDGMKKQPSTEKLLIDM